MGKHERLWSEKVEKNVAAALNGAPSSDSDMRIAESIKRQVLSKLPKTSTLGVATWTGGGAYSIPGDIMLEVNDSLAGRTEKNIEIKVSKKGGKGTKGNVGSTWFKKQVNEEILSYQDFDKRGGFKARRYRFLENKFGVTLKTKKEYETLLRERRDKEFIKKPNKAPVHGPTVTKIASIAGESKEEHASYVVKEINSSKENFDKFNKAVSKVISGNNTVGHTDVELDEYCIIRHYGKEKQSEELVDFSTMDNDVKRVYSKGFGICAANQSGEIIVRFNVHWKNICQGGQSPCFNIFTD